MLVSATNLAARVRREVVDNLTIKLLVLIQVDQLRLAGVAELLLFLDFLELLVILLLGDFDLIPVLDLLQFLLVAVNLSLRLFGCGSGGSSSLELCELRLQAIVLLFELSDELILGTLVDFGGVFNLLGSVRIF